MSSHTSSGQFQSGATSRAKRSNINSVAESEYEPEQLETVMHDVKERRQAPSSVAG